MIQWFLVLQLIVEILCGAVHRRYGGSSELLIHGRIHIKKETEVMGLKIRVWDVFVST